MRQVYALLSLARRYGDSHIELACQTAMDGDMVDVRRLRTCSSSYLISPNQNAAKLSRSPTTCALRRSTDCP